MVKYFVYTVKKLNILLFVYRNIIFKI